MNKSVLITEDEDGVAIFRHYYFCKQKKLPLETKLFNKYFFLCLMMNLYTYFTKFVCLSVPYAIENY